jgi:hypothetical protein
MAKRRETESRSARRVDATGEHRLVSNSQGGLLGLSAVSAKEKRKSGYPTRAHGLNLLGVEVLEGVAERLARGIDESVGWRVEFEDEENGG